MLNAKSLEGTEMIVLTRAEYDELIEDSGDAALLDAAPRGPMLPLDLAQQIWDGTSHPLTAWRKAAGLTQAALAEKSGQRAATISDIESGKTDPRLSTLQALAKALRLEIGDIVR